MTEAGAGQTAQSEASGATTDVGPAERAVKAEQAESEPFDAELRKSDPSSAVTPIAAGELANPVADRPPARSLRTVSQGRSCHGPHSG